jgi:para-nitrobenzyl esterase
MMDSGKAVVSTESGKLEGACENQQYAFKGIPYAAAPIGKLRWLPPQPVTPWNGIRPAKEFGPVALQNPMPGAAMVGNLAMDELQKEDCLFLNVWTPGLDHRRRPVMVWIHGGAFIIGSGSQKMFRGNTLATRGDVVLVSVNYRLGALGFMNLKEATGGKIPAAGCEGLLDQLAAIEWVRDNIESFGGDPDNITIFGESAGAMSIGSLMSMPAARGKFHKCILESGGAGTVTSLEEGAEAAEQFISLLGLRGKNADALRSMETEKLLSAQQKLGEIVRARDNRITPFQPVVDGALMPDIPIAAIRKGSAAGIKILAGTNREEFKLFNIMDPAVRNIDEAGMVLRLENMISPEHVPGVLAMYREARRRRGESVEAAEVLTAIQTDFMFRIPVLQLVQAQHKNHTPAYNYLFTWKSPVMGGALGSCHTLEIGFVFGNYDDAFCGAGADADALSRKIQDAWTAFARTGNPSCPGLGEWKPYGDGRNTMILDRDSRLEKALYEEERSIWDTFEMPITKPI